MRKYLNNVKICIAMSGLYVIFLIFILILWIAVYLSWILKGPWLYKFNSYFLLLTLEEVVDYLVYILFLFLWLYFVSLRLFRAARLGNTSVRRGFVQLEQQIFILIVLTWTLWYRRIVGKWRKHFVCRVLNSLQTMEIGVFLTTIYYI